MGCMQGLGYVQSPAVLVIWVSVGIVELLAFAACEWGICEQVLAGVNYLSFDPGTDLLSH
jgi:hypothetical protein